MRRLSIIPDINDMEREVELARSYNAAFEYNDFYSPQVLDDSSVQEHIIETYRNIPAVKSGLYRDTSHGAFLDVTIHSTDPLIRDASMLRCRQSMEIAGRMGLRAVVFHTGLLPGLHSSDYLEGWEDANVDFFSRLADDFPKVQIFMENMFDDSPEPMAGLAARMKELEVSNFGICLDIAHAVLTPTPMSAWVAALGPYVRHVHINDNDLVSDLHLAVGSGKIDWGEYDRLARRYLTGDTILVEVVGYDRQKASLEYMKAHGIFPFSSSDGKAFIA